jgi:hypothetical protein
MILFALAETKGEKQFLPFKTWKANENLCNSDNG